MAASEVSPASRVRSSCTGRFPSSVTPEHQPRAPSGPESPHEPIRRGKGVARSSAGDLNGSGGVLATKAGDWDVAWQGNMCGQEGLLAEQPLDAAKRLVIEAGPASHSFCMWCAVVNDLCCQVKELR